MSLGRAAWMDINSMELEKNYAVSRDMGAM